MGSKYNWSRFYNALCHRGPALLTGLDSELRSYVALTAAATDEFWSPPLESLLQEGASEGDLREGVVRVLERWRINVAQHLEELSMLTGDADEIGLDLDESIVQELVDAARPDD